MPCAKSILLVEDDPVDAQAIKRAVQDAKVAGGVIHVASAQEALAHLHSPSNDKPTLILLDLNLPGTDGLELLKIIKDDPCLAAIPIVALTASDEPRDVLEGFDLGIAGYMVKSTDYAGLLETVKTIQNYWSLSQFPAQHVGYTR